MKEFTFLGITVNASCSFKPCLDDLCRDIKKLISGLDRTEHDIISQDTTRGHNKMSFPKKLVSKNEEGTGQQKSGWGHNFQKSGQDGPGQGMMGYDRKNCTMVSPQGENVISQNWRFQKSGQDRTSSFPKIRTNVVLQN